MENSTIPLMTVASLSALVECMVTHRMVCVDKVLYSYIFLYSLLLKSFYFLGNAFFFSKNRFSLVGSVQSMPMATFYLIIEKNLTGSLSRIDVFLNNYPGCCDYHNYWWWRWFYNSGCSYYGCNAYNHESHQAFQLFKSSVKIDINNQLIQDQSWNTINLTTSQQCINSSSGKSYVYLPVKVYSTNITSKSSLMHLHVGIRSAITSDVLYASTSGEISVSNGETRTLIRSKGHFIVNVYVI